MGPMAWACVLLTVHQGPAKENFLDSRAFEIPITIDEGARNDLVQLYLYVSRDRGQTWGLADKKPPTEKSFVYRATADGPYWFVVQQENRARLLNPTNPALGVSQRNVVDTLKPRIKVTADRLPNGEVHASWQITEEYPDPLSLQLDYRTEAMRPNQWTHLPYNPQSGQSESRFNPGNGSEVIVRVSIKDRAGNLGEGEATVPASGGAPIPVVGGEGPSFNASPAVRADKTAVPGQLVGRTTPGLLTDPPPSQFKPTEASPPPAEFNTSVPPSNVPPPAAFSPGAPSATAPGLMRDTPRGSLPPVKIVNLRDVKLEFEVAKFGPSGLGGADVYVTIDEGASWSRVPAELPVTLPPMADGRGATPVRGSVTVPLRAEGTVYGFIVAVKSKAGLARPAPKSGEPPQIRLELDATAPKADLLRPRPDPTQRDTLILSWAAKDRNMPSNPVTLEWAERKEGPWTVIGGGPLPNSGQYPWHLPEQIPSRVYLRLTVRDVAGNASMAQTDKAELIDLSVPETSIIGVAPAGR